jgi:hypothetical protein
MDNRDYASAIHLFTQTLEVYEKFENSLFLNYLEITIISSSNEFILDLPMVNRTT